MWKYSLTVLALASLSSAAPIAEYPLDRYKQVDLPVSSEVTTVTFPGPISGVVGSDILIDDGKPTEVEDGTVFKFQVTHPAGGSFVFVRGLIPDVSARLTIMYSGAAYVFRLHGVADDSLASAIMKAEFPQAPREVGEPPEPVRFTPRIGLSLLDRARAYPVLAKSVPKAVEGVTLSAQNRKIELSDLEITIQEVYRFSREDAVVFLLSLKNKSNEVLDIAPSSFAARVGDEKFEQAIANGPRVLKPGEQADAEFAIVGMPDGTRNDLSADNAFTVLVSSARRAVADTSKAEGEPTS